MVSSNHEIVPDCLNPVSKTGIMQYMKLREQSLFQDADQNRVFQNLWNCTVNQGEVMLWRTFNSVCVIAQKKEARIATQAEEFDLMAAAADLDENEKWTAEVYFVEGLGHNLFSVGQFCDSDLEVAFRRNSCFVRTLEGVDLLKGNRSTNLYSINLHEMASASPICLMARATSTKSWKKAKGRHTHPKPVPNSKITSRYTLGTFYSEQKMKATEVIRTFLKLITVLLQSPVIIIRTDNREQNSNSNSSGLRATLQIRSIIRRDSTKLPYELINAKTGYAPILHGFGGHSVIPRMIVKEYWKWCDVVWR
ncbi:hypothetical protein Tco_0697285 [Tanacetum coccineum]